MRVIERQNHGRDEHFTEGEPDLEPPEELAVAELDDETVLEEDLDSRADLEDEVDEDVLASSLEILVHGGDRVEFEDGVDDPVVDDRLLDGDLEDLEIDEVEDRVESLDRILREKLAGDEEPAVDADDGAENDDVPDGARVLSAEFVCPSCFLVRSGTLRAGRTGTLCRDCDG